MLPAVFAFAVPLRAFLLGVGTLSPKAYDNLPDTPPVEPSTDDLIKTIVRTTLGRLSDAGSLERLGELYEEHNDIDGIIGSISVLKAPAEVNTAAFTGCDEKPTFLIDPTVPEAALPFLINHELAHFLNQDVPMSQIYKAAVGTTVVTLAIFGFGLGFFSTTLLALGAQAATYCVCSRNFEARADQFALSQVKDQKHLEAAKACLQKAQASVEASSKRTLFDWALYPPHQSRLDAIDAAISNL